MGSPERFQSLTPEQQEAVHAKLVATMNMGVPITPNLLRRALEDKKKAKAMLEALGLQEDAPEDPTHVGGHTVIGGQKMETRITGWSSVSLVCASLVLVSMCTRQRTRQPHECDRS